MVAAAAAAAVAALCVAAGAARVAAAAAHAGDGAVGARLYVARLPLHSWPDRSARALHLQSGDARLRADKSADPPYTPTDAAFGADLPDRIVQLMTNARYASIVVRGDSDRTVFLPEIISLHTRRELSEIDGIGRASIARIQNPDLAGAAGTKVAQAR